MATVIVDARNVLRSEWPNIPEDELVAATEAWAAEHGHAAVIVFDGGAPGGAIGTSGESADDWIAREAPRLEPPVWVVTSDRGLRARLRGVERTLGGGGFARELRAYRSR